MMKYKIIHSNIKKVLKLTFLFASSITILLEFTTNTIFRLISVKNSKNTNKRLTDYLLINNY
jgi:hypothetical protein